MITELHASGAVTLTGGGTITLSDNSNNYLLQASGGSSMTNVNNTISGSGNIGNGAMAFTNDAGGMVNATSATGNTLTDSNRRGGRHQPGADGSQQRRQPGVGQHHRQHERHDQRDYRGTERRNRPPERRDHQRGNHYHRRHRRGHWPRNGSELNGSTNTVTNAGNLQIPNNNILYMTGTLNNTGTIWL